LGPISNVPPSASHVIGACICCPYHTSFNFRSESSGKSWNWKIYTPIDALTAVLSQHRLVIEHLTLTEFSLRKNMPVYCLFISKIYQKESWLMWIPITGTAPNWQHINNTQTL